MTNVDFLYEPDWRVPNDTTRLDKGTSWWFCTWHKASDGRQKYVVCPKGTEHREYWVTFHSTIVRRDASAGGETSVGPFATLAAAKIAYLLF